MEIIDRYGYIEDALAFIEKNIIAGRNLKNLAKKAGIDEVLLKKLSSSLKNFSEKLFFTNLEEELEERHSSLLGANAENFFADVKIDAKDKKAFIIICLKWNIIVDGENEDKTTTLIKIFSSSNIQIKV